LLRTVRDNKFRGRLIEERGIDHSIDGLTAKVIVSRKKNCCVNCEKDSCDIPEDGIETEAINKAGAAAGQKVKIVMKSFTYAKGSFFFYLFPAFALISGAIPGKTYLPLYNSSMDLELLSAIGGFTSFFASILLVKMFISRMNKKIENKSVIENIIK
jgi:positive regulator of sigma E activity